MKQGLKAVDFTLFRIIPLVFLLFVLYADVRTSFEAFNRIDNYSFYSFLESFSAILCFVILGFSSVLRFFNTTKKFSLYCRYGAGVMALIYIVLSLLERIQSLWLLRSLEYTPVFSDCFSLLSLQKTLYIIAFLTVIMNSVLNDKFFKVKQILTIVCTVSFFGANFCNPLYTLIRYNDTVSFRFLFNSFLYSYSFCAVILTGLFPTKAAIEVPQS